MRRVRVFIYTLAAVAIALLTIAVAGLSEERDRLRGNNEALLTEYEAEVARGHRYRVSDSLNAVKVTELRLTLSEYRKYRKADLEEIRRLKVRQSDLEKVVAMRTEAVNELTARLRDTVYNGDTVRCFDYKSEWTDVSGCIGGDTVTLSVSNRESIRVVETVVYKRFLGFLWRTRKVKTRQVDAVSMNPATVITGIEAVKIER